MVTRVLFFVVLLASVSLNLLWLFFTPPAPIDRAPVSAEIEHVIDPGHSGRYDCVVNDFAVITMSDGSTVKVKVK